MTQEIHQAPTPMAVEFATEGRNAVAYPPEWSLAFSDRPEELLLDHPRLVTNLQTGASFIDYVAAFGTETTVVYVDQLTGRVEAVIDHASTDGKAAHHAHRAVFTPNHDTQYSRLRKLVNTYRNRSEFAAALDELRREIVTPDGAAIMELVQAITISKEVEYTDGQRLDNGDTSFSFLETSKATGGVSGDLTIPEGITFNLPIHIGGPTYQVATDFRYKLDGSSLQLCLSFPYLAEMERAALLDISTDLRGELSVPVYDGHAPDQCP